MKKILVPVDFSACSNNALDYAIEFANRMKASLLLLHVYHVPAYSADLPVPEEAMEATKKAAYDMLEDMRRDILKQHQLEVELKAIPGFSAMTIEEESKDEDVEMVIMGTQGANGLKRILFGSHASHVATHSSVPVLVIPQNATFRGIDKIVLATALDDQELSNMHRFISLIGPFKPEIEIFHVVDGTPDEKKLAHFKNMIDSYLPYYKISFKEIKGKTIEAIEKEVTLHKIDMLVMINHKRNVFQRLFTKSISKEIVFHANIPLMVLPHQDTSGIVF